MKKLILLFLLFACTGVPHLQVTEYGADWCSHCVHMRQLLREEQKSNPSLVVVFVDLESEPDHPEIQMIPYLIIKKDGAEVFRGNASPEQIIKILR